MPALFRADHIGSFLRPAALLEARRSASPDQLRLLEDQHILARTWPNRKSSDLKAATDGEFRRRNFNERFHGRGRRVRFVGRGRTDLAKRDKQPAPPSAT